jgi:O-antigen chain-terminating methyltransferase
MLQKSDSEFSVDTITERMRAGARSPKAMNAVASQLFESHSWPSLSDADVAWLGDLDLRPIALQSTFQPRTDHHYHVNDLLKYHDRAFIQTAYRAILKRGPDATGFNNFLESLRSGRLNKIDVIARLRYSQEGRAKGVQIDGLFFPASIRLLYRVPVLGYLLNLSIAVARLPNAIRQEQQFQNHILAQQEIVVDQVNHIARTAIGLGKEIARALMQGAQSEQMLAVHTQKIEALAAERNDLLRRLTLVNQHLELLGLHLDQLTSALGEEQTARESGLQVLSGQLTSALSEEQTAREGGLRALSLRLGEEAGRLESESNARLQSESDARQTTAELLEKTLRSELEKLFHKEQEVRAELVLQGTRVTRLLETSQDRLAGSQQREQLETFAAEADHTLDALYLSFEDQFRGSREEIKQRLRVYLPLVQDALAGRKKEPILDVGCGRGEWLELLGQEGWQSTGIDSNRMLVQQCRERGLKVIEVDLMDHLRGLPDKSLGVITGFHIVEHLPIETLVKFLDETVRLVKPGGLVIFETPNPQNVLVGSCNFYFDPTHRNPLPSPIMKFFLESRGFIGIQILNLNPSDEAPVPGESEVVRRFNQYFYGPMDYAVVGRRP